MKRKKKYRIPKINRLNQSHLNAACSDGSTPSPGQYDCASGAAYSEETTCNDGNVAIASNSYGCIAGNNAAAGRLEGCFAGNRAFTTQEAPACETGYYAYNGTGGPYACYAGGLPGAGALPACFLGTQDNA